MELNSSGYEKYQYGYLDCWFIKLTQTGKNFQKYNVVSGKTPLFVIGPFCSDHSICLNIGF